MAPSGQFPITSRPAKTLRQPACGKARFPVELGEIIGGDEKDVIDEHGREGKPEKIGDRVQLVSDIHAEEAEEVAEDVGRDDLFDGGRYPLELEGPPHVGALDEGAEGEGDEGGADDKGEDRQEFHYAAREAGQAVAEAGKQEAEGEKEARERLVEDEDAEELRPLPQQLVFRSHVGRPMPPIMVRLDVRARYPRDRKFASGIRRITPPPIQRFT